MNEEPMVEVSDPMRDTQAGVEEPGPEQGGGPPLALPWTLDADGEGWSADLEHGAHLPRVGERIEYITAAGERRIYRVREIVHTIQRSASERPTVRAEESGPNATVSGPAADGLPGSLRAGLPRVVVTRDDG